MLLAADNLRDLSVAFPSHQPDNDAKWPKVRSDEWCGDYEEKRDAI